MKGSARPVNVAAPHSGTAPEELAAAPPLELHVLLLEDSADDAELILNELRLGGYEPVARRVASREEMLEALEDGSWQIVFLDHGIPGGALGSLEALAGFDVDLPAILIARVIEEEEAAQALRAGARDFVSKGNLSRLVPAVAWALDDVQTRRQRREGDEALRQSERRLRLALDAGGLGSWECDLVSGQVHWSERVEQMFGLEPGTFGGTYEEFIGLVHPDDRELLGTTIEAALERGPRDDVYRAVGHDGTVRWHERNAQGLSDAEGRPQALVGVTSDVTEREQAAQALRESEERFRLIAEHARDLISLLDVEGRYRYVSPSFESLLGYPAGELLGLVASELIHPDDWPEGWEWGEWGEGQLREMRMRTADGGWLWVEGLSYEIAGRAEQEFAVIARDVSERKRSEAERLLLEGELRQSQKMEAVGQLAGGIAHDFNNLLTVITGYTELLLRRLGREAEASGEIAEVAKAAEQAARLTRQLLAFSRKQILEPRLIVLNHFVAEAQTMLRRVIGENIQLTTTLAGDLGTVSADEGQIEQVIMNLAVNARDAMPGGGSLVMETMNVSLDESYADRHRDAAAGDYVMLTVTDTGRGMDAATASRIFEPFFTTKERGAGTGLGLSTVYGIVKQSGGHVEVETEPGVGTTFRIYLPRVAEEAETLNPTPLGERSLKGSETILLVEDEEAVRGVGAKVLETYGYTVLLAGDGAEALELAQSYPDPIHLLMTDIMMPKMGGLELAERLSALRPELKVLYTSGYNDRGGGALLVAGARFLQKPYGMEALARTLRELLYPASPRDG